MYFHARRCAGLFGTMVLALVALPARGQDAGVPAQVPVPAGPQPPELLESVAAPYPEQAKAERIEGTVLLRLSIDAEGRVTEAEVTQPAGSGLDEAAREAVLQFRFKPATRNGEPIAARILFPYEFRLPPEQLPEPVPLVVAPPDPLPPAADASGAVEIKVAGARSEGLRLQQSAEAVNVIEMRHPKEQTADLGEVLARAEGIIVRRSGGMGSEARFSLNGLYDDQIRFFLDEIPLEVAGFPFALVDVPINLIDRVEVYRGVVPIRFGADALGGGVHLVTDTSFNTHLDAAYQIGSFGTHRVSVDGRYRDEATGAFAGGWGFFDYSDNDYEVSVEIPDERGRLHPAEVPRFHDDYRAYGMTLEAGAIDRPWTKLLQVRGFFSGYDKELQHNTVMTVPYGEVNYGEVVYGGTARYEVDVTPQFNLEVVGGYTYRTIDYSDQSRWVYSWTGERVRRRRVPGETDVRPYDQTVWQHNAFGRALATWSLSPHHILRASFTPQYADRTGDERLQADPDARDPLTAQREMFTFVSGVEYELNLFGDKLANIVFVKDYIYDATTEEPIVGGKFRKRDTTRHRLGVGNSLRYRFTPWLYAKASYEYATRLPRPDEVFGDAILIHANLELEPEISHNVNLGPRIELDQPGFGKLMLEVNAFLRATDRLIVLLGNDRFFTYQNVYKARGMGLENSFSWESPGRYVFVDGMLTWQDVRNDSTQGAFGDFDGDRIPNRPYLFGSWGARLRFTSIATRRDSIEPFYIGRYLHSFFRGWESQGLREFKQTVDTQVTHTVGLSWAVERDTFRITTTFEVDNLTDEKVFDNFGVERPGRAFNLKLTGEI